MLYVSIDKEERPAGVSGKYSRYLLPAGHCFPMSHGESPASKDMMELILQVVGLPSNDDLAFVTKQNAIDFIHRESALISETHNRDCSLRTLFRQVKNQELVDILESMLLFNPGFRPTARELLQHSVFDGVRDPVKE